MKEKQVNTIDALFREELGNARVQPSDQLWENIQQGLAASQPEEAVVAIPWKIWVAAASVGVMLAIGLTLVLNRPHAPAQELADQGSEIVVPGVETPVTNNLAQENVPHIPVDNGTDGPQTPQSITPAHVAPVPQHSFAANPSLVVNKKHTSSTPEVIIEPRAVLAANTIDLQKPSNLTDGKLPMRTGHDMDKAYAFYSPDEMIVRVPDFKPFEEENPTKESRWAVGGVFSPDFALASASGKSDGVANDGLGVSTGAGVESFASSPQTYNSLPSRAFSSGVSLAYEVNRKLELQGGVTYSSRSSIPGSSSSIFDREGTNAAFAVQDVSTQYSNAFLEVPMTMKYRLRPEKKLDMFLTSGVSTQLHVKNDASVRTADNESIALSGQAVAPLAPYRLNALVGAGAEYKFNDHLSMHLEPLMRKAILNQGVNTVGNPNLSVSIRTGLNYRF